MMDGLFSRVSDKAYALFRQPWRDIRLERGLVSFSFDDFPTNALHRGGDILEDAGWRGTYYAAVGLLGAEGACGRIAGSAELLECLERGHELANHTLNHVRCTETASGALIGEVRDNQSALPAPATSNFAYPFGLVDMRVMRVLSGHVTTGRGIEPGLNALQSSLMNLRANAIYSGDGVEHLLTLVEGNRQARGWLIFYTHDVSVRPSQFGCTPRDLEAIVKAVKASGLEVVTIEEGRRRVEGITLARE